MTESQNDPNPPARRLEETPTASGTNSPDSLVDVALRLANAPHPKMPSEMSARIKAKVMSAHHRQQQASRFRPAFHWLAVATIVIMLLLFGLTPSALTSLPGDPLYTFKQVIEWSEFTAAGSLEAQAFTHLLHAERRAQEAFRLSQYGRISSNLFTSSLAEISAGLEVARSDAMLPPATLVELEARASQISATLNDVLNLSAQSSQIPVATFIPLMTSVHAMQIESDLLPITSPTLTPTITLTPTPTPIQPTFTPSSISPVLTPTQISVQAETAGDNQEDNLSNQDEIVDCDSPPPTWAAAEGWRSLCEGSPRPEDDDINDESSQDTGPPPWAGQPEDAEQPGDVPPSG